MFETRREFNRYKSIRLNTINMFWKIGIKLKSSLKW